MRRSLLAALALIAAASAAPPALASPSVLRLDVPDEIPADGILQVNVTLTVSDFMCAEPRDFIVLLSTTSSAGVKGTFARTSLAFHTEARAYFAESYTSTQPVNLTVRALQAGEVELTARMEAAPADACIAPDGFGASAATATVRVDAPTIATSSGNETSTNETNLTPTTPVTPTAPASSTPGGGRPTTCAPDTQCGYIGEFEVAQESTGRSDTPGAGLVGAVIALAAGAFVLRRKK